MKVLVGHKEIPIVILPWGFPKLATSFRSLAGWTVAHWCLLMLGFVFTEAYGNDKNVPYDFSKGPPILYEASERSTKRRPWSGELSAIPLLPCLWTSAPWQQIFSSGVLGRGVQVTRVRDE